MRDDVAAHHELETELYRLRLLRDLGAPEFRPEAEDAVLDDMEALWHRLTAEERRILEAERAVLLAFDAPSFARGGDLPAVDVDEDAHVRRCLPPRIAIRAA